MNLISDLRSTIKFPTSIILKGLDEIGIELAKSLLDQGGFVIMVDHLFDAGEQLLEQLSEYEQFIFIDFSVFSTLEENIRRLDYVFFLAHEVTNLDEKVSTQEFLEYTKFFDQVLKLAQRFDAKTILTTSIKAHELAFYRQELDSNLDASSNIQAVYTQGEIQRYYESLIIEYIQKVSLDARIVRLALLLGGVGQIDLNTDLGRLLYESINSDALTIYGDGLNAEYYVHLQDAVYGIIKALFSSNTKGEIYSVAYEHEISALSVAYKINEVSDEEKPLEFAQERSKESMASLRIYKPAPNLQRIGWKTRVTFERALRQTYEIVKENSIQSQQVEIVEEEENGNQGGRLQRFFKGEKTDQEFVSDSDIEGDSPLGRLIAQRKQSENARMGSIIMSNRYKSKAMAGTLGINTRLIRWFDGIAGRFEHLKYITLRQLFELSLASVVLIFLYINFISAGINVSFQLIKISIYSKLAQRNISSQEYDKANAEILDIDDSVAQLARKVRESNNLLGLESVRKISDQVGNLQSAHATYAEGLREVYSSISKYRLFMNNFHPNAVFISGQEPVFTVSPSSFVEFNTNELKEGVELSRDGLDTMTLGIEKLYKANSTIPFESVQKQGKNIISMYDEMRDWIDRMNVGNTITSQIINVTQSNGLAIILVDETRPLPLGGAPIGIIWLVFQEGKLTEAQLFNPYTDFVGFDSLDSYVQQEVNQIKSNVTATNAGFVDLFYLDNGDIYLSEMARQLSEKTEKNVQGLIIMDLKALQALLGLSEPIKFNDVVFDGDNLYANLSLVSAVDQGTTTHNQVLLNLFGTVIANTLNSLYQRYFEVGKTISDLAISKDIIIYFPQGGLVNLTKDYKDNLLTHAPDYISLSITSDVAEYRALPLNVDMEIAGLISASGNVKKTIKVNASGTKEGDILLICLPATSSNFVYPETNATGATVQFGLSDTCVRSIFSKEGGPFEVTYDTKTQFAPTSKGFEYILGIRRQPGMKMDYSLVIESADRLLSKSSDGEIIDGKLRIDNSLTNDAYIRVAVE